MELGETAPIDASAAGEDQVEAAAPAPGPVGVGGWLLLFCVSLCILSPLSSAVVIVQGVIGNAPYFGRFPGLLVVNVASVLLAVGAMGFAIAAGVGLWRVRPGAVRFAKVILAVLFLTRVVDAVLPFAAGLPAEANEFLTTNAIQQVSSGAMYTSIWTLYLMRSRRVAATYRD